MSLSLNSREQENLKGKRTENIKEALCVEGKFLTFTDWPHFSPIGINSIFLTFFAIRFKVTSKQTNLPGRIRNLAINVGRCQNTTFYSSKLDVVHATVSPFLLCILKV